MRVCFTFVICLLITGGSTENDDVDRYLRFPEGFKIGVSTASHQIEGAWNISDKGENVWDRFTHSQPWRVADKSNADIACDSYHKFKEDVRWIKELGVDHYRFSISWARVLPQGRADIVSQDGLRYYHNLLDELLANNIEPIVTIYHWDHPQIFEDMGGWMNELMVTWYAQYADIIFREFGPKVKVFATINEPQIFCPRGYGDGSTAPGKILNATGLYLCGHNMLKAHATAYHLYDKKYRSTQNGKIGLLSHCMGHFPKTPAEIETVELSFQFDCGWISHPMFVGDYPEVMKTRVAQYSLAAGFTESRLPKFTPEWVEYIRGTSDYFGLNHYTSHLVEDNSRSEGILSAWELGISGTADPSWERSSSVWQYIVPDGIGELLRKIKSEYNNPPVFILENGISDFGTLQDHQRIKYHHLYLKEVLLAVNRDGCNVQKYTIWSLMDNFQWMDGYVGNGFGLLSVNFSSPNRERIPKLSVYWLKNVTRTRQLE